jgi:hypothetical protein
VTISEAAASRVTKNAKYFGERVGIGVADSHRE